ncbi:MAG TPA: UbiH/UbiF/VisC/COQ6 family ubiquinone biosynthesis hydroxylase [Candidatus Competibacteraceae bacterium]|nr:UbiH/UbiF/VisC/COQ6 family ubiquinone biosynthesis hydroxylase [Candidatus Competibacteraceae bacterium]
MTEPYDVVIAGGGMVGTALACALGGSPLRVALLESAPPRPLPAGTEPDLRVSAISRASQRILAAVGAWDPIAASARLAPYRHMRVWDAAGPGRIQFDAAELGEPELGWIIENRVLQYALWETAAGHDNLSLFCPAELHLLGEREAGQYLHLQLHDGRGLRTRLLVGADGAQSRVRRLTGIASAGWEYEQAGLVATVSTEKPHQDTAWQRFLPTGPLAFLPLFDGQCSIVWSTPHSAQLLALDERSFALTLSEAFDWTLGAITRVGPRTAFPLRLQHAQQYVRPRVALVGDAAHVVHPLAGQGVNLGLLDAAALAEVLLEASAAGRDPGELALLRRYERWRKGHNLLTLGVMDGFKRLFGSTLGPVKLLRNLGLNLTDAIAPVKHLLARHAMGLSGDLPRLARP